MSVVGVRWFVEHVGGHTVISRLNEDDGVATFSFDGGVTWVPGDRTPGSRLESDAAVEEIDEAQAREMLVNQP